MAGRQRPPTRDQACRLQPRAPFQRKLRLGFGDSGGDTAQRRHDDAMAEPAQQAAKTARHFAIARRERTVRWLERRVQQHAHDSIYPSYSSPP